MIESHRFDLPHASVYAVVVVFILSIFLLDKLSMWFITGDGRGLFQKLVLLPTGSLFMKCGSDKKATVSTNLYAEITPEALHKEWNTTVEV